MISDDVVIITKAELEKIKADSFRRGVERGRFEERHDLEKAGRIVGQLADKD